MLKLGNDFVSFEARFGGVGFAVQVPVRAILGIYARETGQGMIFPEGDGIPIHRHAAGGTQHGKASPAASKRPKLRVVGYGLNPAPNASLIHSTRCVPSGSPSTATTSKRNGTWLSASRADELRRANDLAPVRKVTEANAPPSRHCPAGCTSTTIHHRHVVIGDHTRSSSRPALQRRLRPRILRPRACRCSAASCSAARPRCRPARRSNDPCAMMPRGRCAITAA